MTPYCTYCGSHYHDVEYCPKTSAGSSNRHHLTCEYCGSHRHNTDGCPKKWPGPNPIVLED